MTHESSNQLEIAVRRATPADAPTILQVHGDSVRGLGAPYYHAEVSDRWAKAPTPEQIEPFQRAIASEEEVMHVAIVGDRVAGYSSLMPDPQTDDENLVGMYIHPSVARRGAATALLCALESHAHHLGITRLSLRSSIVAEPFYLAKGYRVTGRSEITGTPGAQLDFVRMEKDIG
ncbi:MAG: GNAT family N-acetyltransferase [Planctomycetota bacterium]